jgi:hypothetical protein
MRRVNESPAVPTADDAAGATVPPVDDRGFGVSKEPVPSCSWCDAPLAEPDVARCPRCGTLLKPLNGAADVVAPVTASTIVPGLVTGARAADVASSLGDLPPDVYAPPSHAVRVAMREITLELRGSAAGVPVILDDAVAPEDLAETPPSD